MIGFHISRNRLEQLAIGSEPFECDVALLDAQLCGEVAERFTTQADLFQAIRRHAHFFDLIARDVQCLCCCGKCFFDFFLSRAKLHADLEHRELSDRLGRVEFAQRINRSIAHLHRTRPDARHFSVRSEGEGSEVAVQVIGFDER